MSGWRRLGGEEVFWHPVFGLERQLVAAGEDRKEVIVVHAPDWVNIIPILDDRRVVLIRQWRHGIAAPCLEIPGGLVDVAENADEAAARELLEETGYHARKLRRLGTTHPNPAILSNRLTTYVATDLQKVEPDREVFGVDDERITVELTPMSQIPELIREGAITHALVIAAFHLLDIEASP